MTGLIALSFHMLFKEIRSQNISLRVKTKCLVLFDFISRKIYVYHSIFHITCILYVSKGDILNFSAHIHAQLDININNSTNTDLATTSASVTALTRVAKQIVISQRLHHPIKPFHIPPTARHYKLYVTGSCIAKNTESLMGWLTKQI